MKPSVLAGQIAGALVCVGVGLAGGIWFMQHYDIVPRDETPDAAPQQQAARPAPPSPALSKPVAPAAVNHDRTGPFSYKFQPGDEHRYMVTADLNGSGFQLGESEPVDATFMGTMKMATQSVDASGNGTLDLSFEDAQLQGMFMGGPVNYRQSGSDATFSLDGQTQVDTSRGDSIKGIPQMEFLADTIRTVVSPDGRVLDVSGPQGFDQLLSSSAFVSPVRFQDSEIPVEHEWTTDFQLPVPGLDALVPAKAHNRLVGYQDIKGRRCGVIQQEITESADGGSVTMPSSALGESMGLHMPEFNLTGQNTIYFDVESGMLVHADMDLGLEIELGESFSPVASLFEAFSGLLNEVEGGAPAQLNPNPNNQPLTTLDLSIRANMGLID